MSRRSACNFSYLLGVFLLAGQAFIAKADSVIPCNGCDTQQMKQTAAAAPPGFNYVINPIGMDIRLFENYYNSEMKMDVTEARQVPAGVEGQFQTNVGYLSSLPITAQGRVGAIMVSPGTWRQGPFTTNPFVGMEDASAYDMAGNLTMRGLFAEQLARAMSPTQFGDAAHDSIGAPLNSALFSSMSAQIRIAVRWDDGSQSTFVITAENTASAQYQMGQSKDASSNPLPDNAVTQNGGASLVGNYTFSGNASIFKWLDLARMYGIPVMGARDNSNKITCSWDRTAIGCRFQ